MKRISYLLLATLLGPALSLAQTAPPARSGYRTVTRPGAKHATPATVPDPATSPAPAVSPVPATNTPAPATAVVPVTAGDSAPDKAALPQDDGPAVRYVVSFPNAVHHEARVVATFAGMPAGRPVRVRMARSSPGRYSLHDFIKNVYYVSATDAANHPLALNRPDPYCWDIRPSADGTVVFGYTLYGDRSDGTYVGIDLMHAHLNMPATFCYADGLEGREIEVKFEPLPAWKIATQLQATGTKNTFSAPNLDYLMDSPVVLGTMQTKTWTEAGQNFELAALHTGASLELDNFAQQLQKIVREQTAVFGELPAFSFRRYTFLADYLPQATPDGMEHRNSCSLTSAGALTPEMLPYNLAAASHEFFHAWNVERIRPRDLEPFDYQRTNMSDALWFAEGFTQYYGELTLRRAGLTEDEQFFDRISTWVNRRQNSPGAKYNSAVDMSRQAAFLDAAASVDPTNLTNTTLSYYDQGAGLALYLDLLLREKYRSSLDKYMQALWQQYGKNQAGFSPATPYTVKGLQRVLGEVSRDTAFAGKFFRQYVYGHEPPRFDNALLQAGFVILPSHALGAALPRQVEFDSKGRCLVAVNTTINSGLYRSGVDRGDQILTVDGKDIKDEADLLGVVRKHSPSDVVSMKIRNRSGVEKNLQVVLNEDPNIMVQPVENVEKMKLEPKQKELRDKWLASMATTEN